MLIVACVCASQPLTSRTALTSWSADPLAIALIALLAWWYLRAVRRARSLSGERWPWPRTASFALGLVTVGATTLWWVGAYAHTLFWVYTVQVMTLLVLAPAFLAFGRPITLSRASRPAWVRPGLLVRLTDSASLRWLSSPAFGPLLLPVITGLVFFTPILPLSLTHYPVYEALHGVLLVAGFVMALPLSGEGASGSSLSIAAGILFGFLELLADAVPGIAIRLRTSLLAPEHYLALRRTWGPSPLHDQQLGGAIVWFLAESIDLPILALLVFRWIRADEREAAIVDRALDEQQERQPAGTVDGVQRPWWETDATVFGDHRSAAFRRPPK